MPITGGVSIPGKRLALDTSNLEKNTFNSNQKNFDDRGSMLKCAGKEAIVMITDRSLNCPLWQSLAPTAIRPKKNFHAHYAKPIAGNISLSCEL